MIKVKSMEIEKDLDNIILKFYVNVKNKKRINFAKKIDDDYYENIFFVVETILKKDKIEDIKNITFELFYIGNMDYTPCVPSLNVIEKIILKKELKSRRKYIMKEVGE